MQNYKYFGEPQPALDYVDNDGERHVVYWMGQLDRVYTSVENFLRHAESEEYHGITFNINNLAFTEDRLGHVISLCDAEIADIYESIANGDVQSVTEKDDFLLYSAQYRIEESNRKFRERQELRRLRDLKDGEDLMVMLGHKDTTANN